MLIILWYCPQYINEQWCLACWCSCHCATFAEIRRWKLPKKGQNELFSNLSKNYLFGRVPLVLTLFNDDDDDDDDDSCTPYVT